MLGIKGLSVLEEIISHNYSDMIHCIIVGEDKLTLDDSHSKIIEICQKESIPFINRKDCDSYDSDVMYSFAVGWKWLINTKSFLIVFHDSILPNIEALLQLYPNSLMERSIGVTAFKASKNYDEGDIITSSRVQIILLK